MDKNNQEIIRQGVQEFLQGIASEMQNIPKEFEENKKFLFVFLDHLGFSNKVLKASENYEWLSFCADMGILIDDNLKNILRKCQQWDLPVSKVREKRFSDSICLFWEIGDYDDEKNYYTTDELAELLRDVFFVIGNIQMSASIQDALFRGGIAVGHYFEYNDITVSDALVRAHNIENSIKIPVVGVDESVWKELGKESIHEWFISEGYLTQHIENQREFEYIDFINAVFKNNNILKFHLEGMYFANMRKNILSNWNKAKETMINNKMSRGLKEKYKWLFEYYNKKCNEKNQMKYIIEDKYCDDLKNTDTY